MKTIKFTPGEYKMKNLNAIHLKTKEMLKCFGRTTAHLSFISFSNQKIGIRERKEIRKKLTDQMRSHKNFKKYEKDFDWNSILEIGQKPECPFASISISHCNDLGAFLFIPHKTLSIGFDIEQEKRVTKKLVGRISSRKETQETPFHSLLWTAKEASFKCLSNNETPLLLSDCSILNWKKDPIKEFYFFNCYSKKMNRKSRGIACVVEQMAIAYAET